MILFPPALGRLIQKKKTDTTNAVPVLCAHRAIFPDRLQSSIVAVNELNYCVRDGNRCTLATIYTHFQGMRPEN